MEVAMELSRKTTILLSPRLHDRLTRLARRRGTSMGDLIRRACEIVYSEGGSEDRLEAVQGLAALSLPVADTDTMKRQSVPDPRDLLP
jgi:hypothetical protein